MKKSLYLGVVVLSACGSPNAAPDEQQTQKVATAVFDAFNSHDWDAMSALYAENVKLQDPAYPGGKIGKGGMTDFYSSVPDIHDSVRSMVIRGNMAVVEFVSTGTLNGQQFSLPICSVLTVENGLVVEDRTYYDASH